MRSEGNKYGNSGGKHSVFLPDHSFCLPIWFKFTEKQTAQISNFFTCLSQN